MARLNCRREQTLWRSVVFLVHQPKRNP
jgi:hypothetical protein